MQARGRAPLTILLAIACVASASASDMPPEVVAKFTRQVQPLLVNENVTGIPTINPFQELYYKQFGGSPTPEALAKMDPKGALTFGVPKAGKKKQ
jgi:hypothetical protein